jgi:N-acetylglutamate synthase-like GNAT family acetyltransferase
MPLDMELEKVLRAPEVEQAKYPAKVITLASGKKMVVREAERKDVPMLLKAVKPAVTLERDYYDIVAARLYAELLGWYRYRVRNEYCLIGQVDGYVVGIVNGRMMNQDIGISYHTLAIDRGLRIGAHLFASKMEHHIEYLGQKEVWITAESPIGFRRWMIEYGLEKQIDVQHELGGATSYKLTRDLYFETKPRLVVGTRPVPTGLMEVAMSEIKIADEHTIETKISGVKGR